MNIKEIIEENKDDIAFIIGNGINRFPNNPLSLSWRDLLLNLWEEASLKRLSALPVGISLTEFYDVLELVCSTNLNLQKKVKSLMSTWEPLNHHKLIVEKIRLLNAPILTTNFEETLAKTFDFELFKIDTKFTDFYPWSTYHGLNQLDSPTDGFGIWYINGMINYYRSIKLGLGHYMRCVARANNLINKGNEEKLFSGKNVSYWKGHKTWLHVIFNKSLFIFGLGLEENEIFLRWLLLERAKYFKLFPDRKYEGWYINVTNTSTIDSGRKFFLENVGIKVIEVADYTDIYEGIWI